MIRYILLETKKTATIKRGPPIPKKNDLLRQWRDALCRVLLCEVKRLRYEARVHRTFAISLFVLFIIPLLVVGCGSPRIAYAPPPDAEIDRNAAAARSAYAAGSMASAELFYQKALNRARLTDQSAEIAGMAFNLAVCRAQMQKYNEAVELLNEAQFECNQTGLDFPEIKLMRAEIARSLGQTNEALAIAGAGINALKNQKNNDSGRLQLQLLLAELACDQNDGIHALKELDKIDRRSLAADASIIQAKAANVRGRALLIEKQPADAAICFDNAAGFYQKARRYSDMAKTLQRAGVAYEAANKRQEALNRHYRAARSLFLCGERTRAQESFNRAGELAKESADEQMLSALSQLRPEISPGAASNTVPEKAQAE